MQSNMRMVHLSHEIVVSVDEPRFSKDHPSVAVVNAMGTGASKDERQSIGVSV